MALQFTWNKTLDCKILEGRDKVLFISFLPGIRNTPCVSDIVGAPEIFIEVNLIQNGG